MKHTPSTETSASLSSKSLTDYTGQGKNFLEACRMLIGSLKKEKGGHSALAHEQIEALTELLTLLHTPEESIDMRVTEIWIPKTLSEKEKRYHNYLLWKSFLSNRNKVSQSCPSINEALLRKAIRAGHNGFENKHHIFNLLISIGFPKKQACILTKYLGNRFSN